MPNAITVELLAAGDVSGSGSGSAVDLESTLRRALKLEVQLAPVTGDPGVALSVESRISATAPWRTVMEARTLEDIGQVDLYAYGCDQYVRASYAIPAGVTVHLQVSAKATVLFCQPRDIGRFAMPLAAAEAFDAEKRLAACVWASCVADGYLNNSYIGPITAWDDDLRGYCAKIAAAHMLAGGTDPEGPDKVFFDAERAAIAWLERIANGRLKPPGIVDSTPEEFEGGSVVVSGGVSRGW